MAELRWILLAAGIVFLAGLTLWETRRPRQARGGDTAPATGRSEPPLGTLEEDSPPRAASPALRSAGVAPAGEGRRRVQPPLQIELPPQRLNGAGARGASSAATPAVELETLPVFDYATSPVPAPGPAPARVPTHAVTNGDAAQFHIEPIEIEPNEITPPIGEAPELPTLSSSELVVDWPPDGQRHIVALRIVSASEERLSGRAVRLAISACGFIHGRFGIYHQPGVDGRSLLSVASLSKPGILDPENLDFQRLGGINLFTVLPGPLPPAAALDHLVDTARELSERLHARLLDEHGQTLDADRLEHLRDSLQGLDTEPAA